MIIYHSSLVTALQGAGYPVYFEKFDTEKDLPCYTYMEVANVDLAVGDTLSYSEVAFQVKAWGRTISEAATLAAAADTILKSLGFKRTFSFDTLDGDLCVKVMRYNGLGLERQ